MLLRRVAQQSLFEGVPETVVKPGDTETHLEPSAPARSLATGKALLAGADDPGFDCWTGYNPARARALRKFGLHSMMCIPVRPRGRGGRRGLLPGTASGAFRAGRRSPGRGADRQGGGIAGQRPLLHARARHRRHPAALPAAATAYAEGLRYGFARIPFTRDPEVFTGLQQLGGQLAKLHLLEHPDARNSLPRMDGDDTAVPAAARLSPETQALHLAEPGSHASHRGDVGLPAGRVPGAP